jgi:hypothetical protein
MSIEKDIQTLAAISQELNTTIRDLIDVLQKDAPKPAPAVEETPTEKIEVPEEVNGTPVPDLEAVRATLTELGRDRGVKLLASFGCQKLSQLDESKYAELLAAAAKGMN